jgi:hypothetical protein
LLVAHGFSAGEAANGRGPSASEAIVRKKKRQKEFQLMKKTE